MNKVVLIGRLTKDIEMRYSSSNLAIGRFSLAVDRKLSKDKRTEAEARGEATADFISCIGFGKSAETLEKYTQKGSRIAIGGHIQTSSYTKDDGQRVYTTDVIVDEFDLIDFKTGSSTKDDGQITDREFSRVSEDLDDLPF